MIMKSAATLISSISLICLILAFTKLNKKEVLPSKASSLVEWYGKLLEKSLAFIEKEDNKHFKDSVQLYIDTCKVYNFRNHTRLEPYICQPILFNKTYDKALILVLSRTLDLGNERVEYIKYISAKYVKGKWIFKVKTGHSNSFSYFKNSPTISDTEIGMNILNRLVQYGYINGGEIYSDKLFNSDMYVLK